MRVRIGWIVLGFAAVLGACATVGGTAAGGIERLYVFDCGINQGKDQARWSPGVNVGKPIEFSDNCYLIRHKKGLLLWDTGIADAVAAMPGGLVTGGGSITQRRSKTLAAQLAEIGVKPADIAYVAVSHTHGDHVGNVALFPSSTVLIQAAEYDWAMGQQVKPAFAPAQKFDKLAGDRDVFGDGSVTILATPGHTPGHQSLLVKLPKTGALLLSGDAVHFRDNWDNRRVPSMNTSGDQTVASMERIATVLKEQNATLWINHDMPQSAQIRHSPGSYE
jgi:N-acyl homoserine lactone hydrolase